MTERTEQDIRVNSCGFTQTVKRRWLMIVCLLVYTQTLHKERVMLFVRGHPVRLWRSSTTFAFLTWRPCMRLLRRC